MTGNQSPVGSLISDIGNGFRIILKEGWASFTRRFRQYLKWRASLIRQFVHNRRFCIQYHYRKLICGPLKFGRLKVSAVTMVYNEELILPYFLRHYRYLDEIHVLFETDSTDQSKKILSQAENVVIHLCHIEGGIDDTEKARLINEAFHQVKADWVYLLDPDEFIFPVKDSPRRFLKHQHFDVVRAAMYQVYRHRSEKDLDPSLSAVPQRVHGDTDLNLGWSPEDPNRTHNALYIKPIVLRPLKKLSVKPGQHQLMGDVHVSDQFFTGAHWNMADQSIALCRRMLRRARLSRQNYALKMGVQNWHVTEEWITEECNRHLDDPVIEVLLTFEEQLQK